MAAPHNVEFEAAKFLQKLIHESTDEPAKLATKLYVILQHMKASGKENSMPYQVISRAMETVINQHGLDIEALTSSRLPLSTGPQGESASAHMAACSQTLPTADSKSGMAENDSNRTEGFASCRPSSAPNSLGNDHFQGSASQRSGKSFDHESPSSIDTKSTNSQSQDRRETASWEQQGAQKNSNKPNIKRKRSDSSAVEPPDDSIQQMDSHNAVPDLRKERLTGKVEMPGNFPGVSDGWKQGFSGATSFRNTGVPGQIFSPNQAGVSMANFNSASRIDAAGIQVNADRLLQAANPSNLSEVGAVRTSTSRDTGKAPAIPASVTNLPFKEHHLKQLRAQCLVFLAFRNGLAPKRLHLEIALGNIFMKEGIAGSVDGAQNEQISDKGKQPTTLESSCTAEVALQRLNSVNVKNERAVIGAAAAGFVPEASAVVNEPETVRTAGAKMGLLANQSLADAGKNISSGGTFEDEMQRQEMSNSSVLLTTGLHLDRSGMISPAVHSFEGNLQPDGTNHRDYGMGVNKQPKPEMTRWTVAAQNDIPQNALHPSIPHEFGNRNDGSSNLPQHEGDNLTLQRADSHLSTCKTIQGTEDVNGALDKTRSVADVSRMVPGFDSSYSYRSPSPLGSEPEEEDKSVSVGLASSPKYTLSEKWIIAHQKRKVVNQQKWAHKLQKADQRIVCCFNELKETVSSSEDISAKTRSVIELKKLQLLQLQRCLRRNIMNDFFKPVRAELDQLKSIKRHRIGRRLKHVEKFEQKMKEERQKRIRERQKEFFSEIEVHREKLEDVFKFKRERCKGINRYVKEFHKRKERIHREKIDRIQREKINLLKINDVEGYLRMVQDAKSDRVNKLLKETEKYLQKLGSRLQEAKSSSREDMDENRVATCDVGSENAAEMEDENDQAKHYKESNEKYYLIAHSIKESITEQPSGIQGGKLREYQMNGLRWLVSLYNNHLNGILADEMGLGKTVQVISLLCYLMEAKNDRGPFLVVVPSSVLPGWERELSFWAPGINKIVYAGPPEERRRLFKDCIVHQKFNVLLTTYEYLMNKHDRPKLSKIHWHYVIIDEGHRIKNASCKLNAELKHYRSSHRLLLTGTPLQNSLEELWALLNFLLPNIFNSSEDFSQWFNKPFEGNGDNTLDEALLSEEENLLIINRLHQVLRPFVLRRLKHKVENELPEKIERLVRCEASAYQKLLMKRVEENLGSLGMTKGRAIHNTVMELRNICNHPYLSQLHVEEVENLIPKHFLPPIIRFCGKLEMLDRLLPKLKETNHRVLFFSTMTRLLDIMEDYLVWKKYLYLRLDGHTSGQDRGALIEKFNQPDSPYFIFLLSIRAGGVGVNLQAADTVIIFDTDWNPQVDLQAQARAHRIGQKKDVLVLRLETVKSVEEQVRAAAEHKLGVANQSITAGFFDNNTSAEDRREYLESLLRESKKEEAAPVLDDDSLNDILARSESEIEVFEAIDHRRREEEMATWESIVLEHECVGSEASSSFPSRLVTENDLKAFYEAMKVYETSGDGPASSSGAKRKGGYTGGFDSQQYGRGKRAREVRSYEEHWSEEEFEKMCQSGSPETLRLKDEKLNVAPPSECGQIAGEVERPLEGLQTPPPSMGSSSLLGKEVSPHVRRGRGRPKRTQMDISPSVGISSTPSAIGISNSDSQPQQLSVSAATEASHGVDDAVSPMSKVVPPALAGAQSAQGFSSAAAQPKRQGRKGKICQNSIRGEQGIETVRRRGRNPKPVEQPSSDTSRSMNASIKVTQDNSSADGPRSLLPKGSEGSDILTLGDAEALDLTANRTSLDASLKAASPTPGTLVEGSVKQAVLNSSAVGSPPPEPQQVNKGDMVPPGKIRSIAKSSAVSNSLTIDKGTHIDSTPPTASSSELQPSLTPLRAGRRQSQKSTNATEPVRRRGRKRGASASADLTPPIVQSLKSPELFKNTGSTSARFQAQGQDQRDKSTETVPHRRGRKKGAVLLAGPDHSVGQYSLATRSRQPDGEDGQLPERKVIATRSRQVSRSVVPAPCIEESSSAKAVSIGKPLETRQTSAVEETNQYGRPADFPPISSKGRTNVIVLALDATSCSVHPIGLRDRNMREKKEFSELQMESALNASMLKPEDSRLDISPATGIEAAKLDEELSAPPGFETPRACVSTVNKPEEHNECKTSKSPDVKMGSVVLALESASQSIDPSIRCQNVSENEDTSKVHTIRDSEQGTVVPAVPEGHVLNLEAATDKVTSCQPDEDMLAPPGFAIPQQCLSETDTAKILESDNLLPSDVLADSAIKVKEDVIGRGPSGDKETNDSCNSLTASTGVGSGTIDASTVESKDEELCQGSDDAAALTSQLNKEFKSSGPESADVRHPTSNDAPLAAKDLTLELKGEHVGPQNTAASPLEPKDEEESHGPDNGNAELSAHDKLPASVVPIHESAEVPALDSGPRNTKDVVVDAFNPSVAGPLTAETSVLTPKEQGETHGPDAGNTEFGTHDIPTASMVPNSASVMAPKVDEEACGPINSVQDIVDASIASVAGLNESASVLEPTEKKESHGTDDGNNDFITPNIPTASMVPNSDLAEVLHVTPHVEGESCGPDNTEQGIVDASIASVACPLNEPASALEPIEQKESHGTDDGNNDLITPNIPTASMVPNSDSAEVLPMAPQVEGEACGPDNTEQDLVVASVLSVPCPLNEPASALEPIEQKESHGSDDGNNDLITPNIPTASVVPISDSAEVLPLAPPVEGEACGPDNTEQDIVDASIASVACPLNKQASSLELIEQKECHGTVDGNTDLTTHDIHTGSVVPNSESVEVLAMAPQVEGEAFGPDNTKQDIVDTSIVSVASPLNEAASALEQIEQKESHGPDNTERDIVDAPIVHVAGTLNAAALALEVKKQEELHEPDSGNALLGVENIPTASVVLNSDSVDVSALAPKEDSEASGLGNTEQGIIDTSVAGHLNAEASTFEPNEQEESHGPNNGNGVLGAHDMPTVSVVLNSDLADASTLARKEDEEAGPGDIEQDAVDVSTASVAGPHNPAASALEPKTQEELQGLMDCIVERGADVSASYIMLGNDTARAFTAELHNEETFRGPGGGHADNDTVSDVASTEEENSQCPSDGKSQIEAGDNHTISQLCSNTLAGAVLKEKNDCQGHGNTEHNMVDASSASVAGPYDIGVSILESKERNESHGPRNAEYNAGDASSASVGGPCISAASTLELKDQEESHGPANRNDDLVARDDQTTSVVPNSDSAEVSALAPKREEDTRGVDDYNVQLDTPGPPSSVMVGHDTAAVLDPEPQEEVLHGTGSGPCEDNVSPMQLKEEGNGANGKAEDDAGDDQTTSRMVGSDALAESTSESIGNND